MYRMSLHFLHSFIKCFSSITSDSGCGAGRYSLVHTRSLLFLCIPLFLRAAVLCKKAIDTVRRAEQVADRAIVIQSVNQKRDVFAHIASGVVWLFRSSGVW